MRNPTDADRLATRHRPDGQPVMHQDWGKLLFMHWRIPENILRPHVPDSLEIDTYGGSAWIAIRRWPLCWAARLNLASRRSTLCQTLFSRWS